MKRKRKPAEQHSRPERRDQFDELFERFKDDLFNYICHMTGDKREAEDLFQETWIRVVKKGINGGGIQNPKAWLFTIAANLYRDALRKKQVRRLFLNQDRSTQGSREHPLLGHMPGGRSQDPADVTEGMKLGEALIRAIGDLPDRMRQVIILKELEGFKLLEISQILKLPLGTVKSLNHRAVKHLRRTLAAFSAKSINLGVINAMQRY